MDVVGLRTEALRIVVRSDVAITSASNFAGPARMMRKKSGWPAGGRGGGLALRQERRLQLARSDDAVQFQQAGANVHESVHCAGPDEDARARSDYLSHAFNPHLGGAFDNRQYLLELMRVIRCANPGLALLVQQRQRVDCTRRVHDHLEAGARPPLGPRLPLVLDEAHTALCAHPAEAEAAYDRASTPLTLAGSSLDISWSARSSKPRTRVTLRR